jgi:hypothetical protein
MLEGRAAIGYDHGYDAEVYSGSDEEWSGSLEDKRDVFNRLSDLLTRWPVPNKSPERSGVIWHRG